MIDTPPHLRVLEEIEHECVLGLVEVLCTDRVEGVRYALWDMTNWHADYDPCVWRSRATEEQKREGWDMWMWMEKILCRVLNEARERQLEKAMDVLSEGAEGFYGNSR